MIVVTLIVTVVVLAYSPEHKQIGGQGHIVKFDGLCHGYGHSNGQGHGHDTVTVTAKSNFMVMLPVAVTNSVTSRGFTDTVMVTNTTTFSSTVMVTNIISVRVTFTVMVTLTAIHIRLKLKLVLLRDVFYLQQSKIWLRE